MATGGHPKLLGGEDHRGALHLRHGLNFCLHLGGAVGTVQPVNDVHPGFQPLQGGDDLLRGDSHIDGLMVEPVSPLTGMMLILHIACLLFI